MVSSKDKQTSRAAKAAASIPNKTTRPTAPKPSTAKKPSQTNYSVEDLMTKIEQLASQMEFPLAIKFAKKAVEIDGESAETWEVLGSLYAEVGETGKAREAFQKAADLQPDSGPSKFLYLAQLSTSADAINYYEKGVQLMEKQIEELETEEEEAKEEVERAISSALCGMAEIYMTDLCDEPDAESRCTSYIARAISRSPRSPEPLQLQASLLLTQQDRSEALSSLEKSMNLWHSSSESPEDLPEFGFRLECAKLLTELGQLDKAIEVLEALREEDDEFLEMWYCLGWAWYLKGKGKVVLEGEEEEKQIELDAEGKKAREECWILARHALKMVIKLYARIDIPVDDELAVHAHTKTLLEEIATVLPQGEDEDMDDGWEDVEDADGDEEMEE